MLVSSLTYNAAMDPIVVVERALRWIRRHPEEVLGVAKDAAALRLTVPLDAIRWLVSQAKGKRAPTNVEISSSPPGIRIGADLNLMKTAVRATATAMIEEVRFGAGEARFTLRLQDVALSVIGQSESPIATLIQSGALDLSQPGKLVAHLPKRPAYIIEADGDRIVIDLMREPQIAARLHRISALVTPIVTVRAVDSHRDALRVQLSCFPDGLSNAIDLLRARSKFPGSKMR
jgi:hypothetical protein